MIPKCANVTNVSRIVLKRNFELVGPAKIQISLRMRAVGSGFLLGAFWIAKIAKCLQTENKKL